MAESVRVPVIGEADGDRSYPDTNSLEKVVEQFSVVGSSGNGNFLVFSFHVFAVDDPLNNGLFIIAHNRFKLG